MRRLPRSNLAQPTNQSPAKATWLVDCSGGQEFCLRNFCTNFWLYNRDYSYTLRISLSLPLSHTHTQLIFRTCVFRKWHTRWRWLPPSRQNPIKFHAYIQNKSATAISSKLNRALWRASVASPRPRSLGPEEIRGQSFCEKKARFRRHRNQITPHHHSRHHACPGCMPLRVLSFANLWTRKI